MKRAGRQIALGCLALALLGAPLAAQTIPLPEARPEAAAPQTPAPETAAPNTPAQSAPVTARPDGSLSVPIPRTRPQSVPAVPRAAQVAPTVLSVLPPVPRPPQRPAGRRAIAATPAPAAPAAPRIASTGAGLCGIPGLQGDVIQDISGRGGCGVTNAVQVRSVQGVALSTPLVIDCQTAVTFNRWVSEVAIPSIGNTGGGLAFIQTPGGYSCRAVVGTNSNRLSEHGRGKAVDVVAFRLRDGTTFNVLNGWRSAAWGNVLRQMHRAACGMFGTVLGPEANAAHRDHLHFDTASRRSAYCR
ncbi:extensin-like domain-containing protein [Ketogulonicigenium vulgare]|uniref:Extensin-like protein n=1 Tax=Ketogulonicigenium vulgare (strain WSH-001) TaxID=759362 RepID=F9YAA9_KETVW|nr:extensin family protein [Ketogulonicigenium vulgare]AEM40282.1 Extensin-like protein [Ketogulonicigenium vulgare WSH-001]AOZ53988.1 Extensin-like protein [Ketogulonicigenium vulgare]